MQALIMKQFQVRKDDFSRSRLVDSGSSTPLNDGEIRAKISRFAFTANNVTYAAAADMVGYWQFFPPVGDDTESWGVIPVWGFAQIVESRNENVPVEQRIFGYLPPANELVMAPKSFAEHSFIDGVAHRSALPAGYNLYRHVSAEPADNAPSEDERMLLWPLFITSFCLWDALKVKDWYGAKRIVIICASSKTSIGTAYALHDDNAAPAVVGLTSARNQKMVESLGLYDSCMTYDDLAKLDASIPTVIVDMSGNSELLGRLHKLLGENMKFCVNVGITHWDAAGGNPDIIADRSEFFFAPAHIQMRIKDWGSEGFDARTARFFASTVERCRGWLTFRHLAGLNALEQVYPNVCAGNMAPDEGLVIVL
jgi:hypothetical protein